MQTKINGMIKPKLHVPKNISNRLLHGHKSGGGLEIPHLWDETNIAKLGILQAGLWQDTTDLNSILRGAVVRAQQWNKISFDKMTEGWTKLIEQDKKAWISSLIVWMQEHNITIQWPKRREPRFKRGDGYIAERYISYQLRQMTAEQKVVWGKWSKQSTTVPPETYSKLSS